MPKQSSSTTTGEKSAYPSSASLRKQLPRRSIVPRGEALHDREPGEGERRFAGSSWLTKNPAPVAGLWWPEIPDSNRALLLVSGVGVLTLMGHHLGPPIVSEAQRAIFPYTGAGQQATCLDNLRAIHQAVATYAQDNEGRLPLLDAQTPSGERLTWVSSLKARALVTAQERNFQCPTTNSVPSERKAWTASYVMNPVLAGQGTSEADDPSKTLLLADGGELHDLSLLPPFPSWPSVTQRSPSGGQNGKAFDARRANFGFRHDGMEQGEIAQGNVAGVVYADGHASPLVNGDWALSTTPWGGSSVVRRALERLETKGDGAKALIGSLRRGDVKGATRLLGSGQKSLRPTCDNLIELWRLNRGEGTSDSVEEIGWHLARALEGVGDGSARQALDVETGRRSAQEGQRAKVAGNQDFGVASEYSLILPARWTREEQVVGRYRRTTVRSALPSVFALVEIGERTSYSGSKPVDWDGMERDLKNRYGAGYRRITRETGSLNGHPASVWEYEIEKAGSPRLRKRAVGYVSGWQSCVVAFTSPALEWARWQSVFGQGVESFGPGGDAE
jgi:hypothetical protein